MRTEELAYFGENANCEIGVHHVAIQQYPDGCPLITERPIRVVSVLLRPRSMTAFFGGIAWIEAVLERGLDGIGMDLILPFAPGSRQDRLNSEGDFLFTAKSIAKTVNRLGLSVTVLDPHSDVVPALIDRCTVHRPSELLGMRARCDERFHAATREWAGVVSPDAGAEKRAGGVAREFGLPLRRAWKTRDLKTGAISGFGMEPTAMSAGNRFLVVDDICDGGGTFLGLADVIDRERMYADLYVTHGLFTNGTEQLCKRFVNVYCTDSIVVDRPGVQVIPICEELLKEGAL